MEEAEPLYREALAGFGEVLGAHQPSTGTVAGGLATLLLGAGRAGEAAAVEDGI